MSSTEYELGRQAEAARALLAGLKEDGETDQEVIVSAVEGETDLIETIGMALDELDNWGVLESGLVTKMEQDEGRLHTIRRRMERVRASIEMAMMIADLPNLRLPTATLSISKRKPGVIVSNEAEIPSRFWVVPEPAPKLDKRALAEALASNESVPGASLDNGSVSLTIRRK